MLRSVKPNEPEDTIGKTTFKDDYKKNESNPFGRLTKLHVDELNFNI
jgi:hypothetical protein